MCHGSVVLYPNLCYKEVGYKGTAQYVNTGIEEYIFQVWIHKIFKRKLVNFFLPISFIICFGYSKEPSHRDGSFEHPQHMFWMRNKKINFLVRTLI